MSAVEKEGAALVTRPRPIPNDQSPPTVTARSDDLADAFSVPPALDSALRRVSVSLAHLAGAEATARDRELLRAEIRDLRRRVPGLEEDLGGTLSGAPEPTRADLTAKEAARLLNLARPNGSPQDSLYDHAEKLGGYKINGRWRFPRAAVDAYRNGERREA